jgi:glycosyltransferase involved in cell wall biosynthesis
MRITIILGPFFPIPPVLGGAVEKVHFLLGRAYRDAGHYVTIISRKYRDFADDEVVDGIRYLRIPSFDNSSSLLMNLMKDFRYALRASRKLPPSDITITNSFFLPLLLPRRTAGRIYVHAARFPKGQMFLYSRADRIQAISSAVASAIICQAPQLSNKVFVVGYPLDDVYFRAVDPVDRKKTILFVGRIAREKGIELLIKALRYLEQSVSMDLSGWKLRIVGPHEITKGGDGVEYLRELRGLAASLKCDCEFAGAIFDEHVLITEYRRAMVFVYPSLAETGEAFGLAPLEAMATGCAVVVSNLDCFDDFIDDGVNGFKFDHRSSNPEVSLALTIRRLIVEPDMMKRIVRNGTQITRRFHTCRIAQSMIKDFEKLIGDPHASATSGKDERRRVLNREAG